MLISAQEPVDLSVLLQGILKPSSAPAFEPLSVTHKTLWHTYIIYLIFSKAS